MVDAVVCGDVIKFTGFLLIGCFVLIIEYVGEGMIAITVERMGREEWE